MTDVSGKLGGEYDLVVVGSGAAGLAGAATASTLGLKVAVIEKSDLIGGTSAKSGGGWWCPGNYHMAEVGLDDSREEALAYLKACAPDTDAGILETIVDTAPEYLRFLEEEIGLPPQVPWPNMGGTIDYRPWHRGSRHGGRALFTPPFVVERLGEWGPKVRMGIAYSGGDKLDYYRESKHLMHSVPDGQGGAVKRAVQGDEVEAVDNGTALVSYLLLACLDRGVDVFLSTPARKLIVEDSRVVGVEVEDGGQPAIFTARGGVLMATGGYAHNRDLVRRWLRRPLTQSCEVEENQGDGHLMGIAVGADVANLGDAWWMPHLCHGESDEGPMSPGTLSREERTLPHTLIVNRNGVRFVNEAMNYYDFGDKLIEMWQAEPAHLPAWLIFDQQAVDRYLLLQLAAGLGEGGTAPEWLHRAETVGKLAADIGLEPEVVAETVERFNGFARTGVDLDFGRGESDWDKAWADPDHSPNGSLGTVERAPFYAVEMRPSALGTKGGLRVDTKGQVLRAGPGGGEVIGGLYAAGNCSSGAPFGSYPGPGITLGSGMTFAYLAARDIAGKLAEQV